MTTLGLLYRLRTLYNEHKTFAQTLILFTVFRALAIILVEPGKPIAVNGQPDLPYFDAIGGLAASGQYPFLHYWSEYPPIIPWLVVAAHRLSLLIPAWIADTFWFNTILHLLLLPFEAGVLFFLYILTDHLHDRQAAIQSALTFASLFAPFFVSLSWFEGLVLFFTLLGIYGMLHNKPALTGLGTGLGFGIKLFPIALLPAALRVFTDWRRLLILLAVTTLCILLVFGPFLIASPAYTLGFFKSLSGRTAWQSVWALLDGYKSYGEVAPLAIRNDPTTTNWIPPDAYPSRLPWPLISAGFAALGLFLWSRRVDWQDGQRSTAFVGLTFGPMLLYAKGYSMQWNLYSLTLALILMPGLRGLVYGILYSILTVLEWPIVLWMLPYLKGGLDTIIIARTLLTIIFCLDCAALYLPAGKILSTTHRFALPAALLAYLLAALALAGPAWRAYAAARLDADPLAPLIRTLQTHPQPVIVIQNSLVKRLRPYLPDHTVILMPNGNGLEGEGISWVKIDDWLTDSLAPYQHAWLAFDNAEEGRRALYSELRLWFDTHACPIEQTWYGNDWAGHYVTVPTPPPQPLQAEFVNGLLLSAATPPTHVLSPGEAFCIRLSWKAQAPLPIDYVVFVHLLSDQGQLVAQSDLWPPTPTSLWSGSITTTHGLLLPTELAPGNYTLLAGLYNPGDGSRLPLLDEHDSVHLADLTVRLTNP